MLSVLSCDGAALISVVGVLIGNFGREKVNMEDMGLNGILLHRAF